MFSEGIQVFIGNIFLMILFSKSAPTFQLDVPIILDERSLIIVNVFLTILFSKSGKNLQVKIPSITGSLIVKVFSWK